MARLIPNQNTRIDFVIDIADITAPTTTEITGGTNLTGMLTTLEASTSGQSLPTPSFESLFETNIPGTASATFTAEFYRDDESDTAWTTLPRGTEGHFVIARFGYSGTDNTPATGDDCEVWPVRIITRSAMALTNNEVQRFGLEAAVPTEPAEDATVA